jgi:3-hydroxy-5-methyl-1-naphthoate 3-O-methyltransferase
MQSTAGMKPVEALNRLLDIATSYCVSQAFFTACDLGLFERLSHGAMTAEDLGQKLNIHPHGCARLLAVLRHLGLVEREGEQYRNTEVSSYCTSQSAVPLGPVSMMGNPFYHMWEFLPDALREYAPRWRQALGSQPEEVFDALYEDPARLRRFIQWMYAFSLPQGQVVAEQFDFTPYRCVLDVAGGSGGLVISIGQRYPHLRGIVMDLPPVCEIANEYIQAGGLAGRFTTAAADLFTGPYPTGAEVITLASILHDWSDEKCRAILRHCYEALPSQGVLLVCEKVLNNDFSGDRVGLLIDLHMLLVSESGAKERSEAEYRSLLEEAGFQETEIIRLHAPRDLILARKA